VKRHWLLIVLAVATVAGVIWLLRSPWLQQMGGPGGIIGSILPGSSPGDRTVATAAGPEGGATGSRELDGRTKGPLAAGTPLSEALPAEHSKGLQEVGSSSHAPESTPPSADSAEARSPASSQPLPVRQWKQVTVRLPALDSRTSHVGDPVVGMVVSSGEFQGDFPNGRLESVTPDQPGSLLILFTTLTRHGDVIPIEGRVVDVIHNDAVSVNSDGTISARQSLHLPAGTLVTVRFGEALEGEKGPGAR
jgi:hypothetical protein